jgi:septum site-determining protein MinD
MGKTIGIISIKGGVGKTSSTAALGAALANEYNQKVLLVDANFSSPHLGFHVGLFNPEITLHHVLDDKANIKEAIYETQYGFDLLPGALVYEKVNPFKLIDKIREIKRKYDIILIDSSPNLNEEMLSTMLVSDDLIVITTPDYVTMATTLRAIKLAKERNTNISGIIINKSYGKEFELEVEEIEKTCDCNVLAVIPHDVAVIEALSKAKPSTLHKKSKTTREYTKLAGALIGESCNKIGFGERIRRMFGKVPKQDVNRVIFAKERLKML